MAVVGNQEREPRDADLDPGNRDDNNPDNTQDNNETHEEPCNDPRCTLSKHPWGTPHSYENLPTRDKGPSPRLARHDAELIILIDDVSNQALAVRTEDILTDVRTPNSFKEMLKSKHKEHWLESMRTEIGELMKNQTWITIPRGQVPTGRKVTKSKWVYKVKLNRDGSIERFKSRFVVCGYSLKVWTILTRSPPRCEQRA